MTVDGGTALGEAAADGGAVGAYLDHLDRVDPEGATRLVLDLLDRGWSVADVLVDVVSVAQREIGRRWLAGGWSVAQEHAATHVSEQVVAAVGRRTGRSAGRGHVVLACVEGEWHALAARIVAEVVRASGWRVTFLGASVPPRHLVSYLHQTGPDAVLLSCVQPSRLIRAARMIEACRATGVPVVAGGPGFGAGGRWATAVGAAACGASARDAVELLDRHGHLASAGEPAPPPPDDEHVAVLRRRREVVQGVTRALVPAGADADPVADAAAQVLDSLAAALLVGDPELLDEFVRWQRQALGTRDSLLDAILAGCATGLAEHPRAIRYLRLVGPGG
ncbi:Methanogenic corrinoid protein MtbC1 [Micromonospora inyonensis]|uniref:Methanogenic corrinoid protein MtbC1 n=1 Tax=Micromonospora inyonensis TaxID=47866 RepID=A0A1C6R7H0_9ACTN|nr:Methanogenic corrinoid protein MtbC1 [Micromonospora inyonensis]